MIEDLPKHVGRRDLEQKIKVLFGQIMDAHLKSKNEKLTNQIMQVVSLSEYGECHCLVNELKLYAGKYKQVVEENLNSQKLDPDNPRVELKKKKFGKVIQKYDAENYYKAYIEELMEKIRVAEQYHSKQNTGTAFVVFKEVELANKMVDTKWVTKQLKEKVSIQVSRSLGVENLIINRAYLESDIIWENLSKSLMYSSVKRLVFFLALVIITLLILTPAYAVQFFSPYWQHLANQFSETNTQKLVYGFIEPLILLTINFGIIPFIIDMSSEFEDYRRKSSK